MATSFHKWILLIIVTSAAALRLWRIDSIPPGFHFDEAFEGLEAWRILTEPGYRPIFLAGNFGVPPLNAYANALTFAAFRLFGGEAGPTAMRVTAAGFGVLGVWSLYGLAIELRRLTPERWPLSTLFPVFAAASLAGMRWHIHFSRMGIEPILTPLIWTTSGWFLLRGWRTGRRLDFAACGVVLAIGMYAYQGAWVIPFLQVMAVGHLIISARISGQSAKRNGEIRERWIGLAIGAGVAAAFFVPLGWFFWRHPDWLWLRPTQLAIVGGTGSLADVTVSHNLWAIAKMFGPFGASGDLDPRRNLPGLPALNLWLAAPFYLGLLVALRRAAHPGYALALIGLGGLLLPGVFSEYAPHFHRSLGAAAPAALLCGIGLDWLWQLPLHYPRLLSRGRRPIGDVLRGLTWLFLLVGTLVSTRDYFTRWAASPDLFYAFDVGLWEVGQWSANREPDSVLYITPRGLEHPTLAFAWRERVTRAAQNMLVSFDGRHIFPLSQSEIRSPEHYTVIEHEDFRTRLLLPELFPQATVDYELSDYQGQLYARIYTRPANSITQRAPAIELTVELGDGIDLLGYDLLPTEPRAGEILYLQLHWLVNARPSLDWTVFTHVVDEENGAVRAGYDSLPGDGSLPTIRWQPGWRILDEYQIPLPADLPPGSYGLRVGLYLPSGERLPAAASGVDLGDIVVD
jgi:hypothetical protein